MNFHILELQDKEMNVKKRSSQLMTQLMQAFFSQLHKFRNQLYFKVTVKPLLKRTPNKADTLY